MVRDKDKPKEQLIAELVTLRKRIEHLEALETEHQRVEKALRLSEARHLALLESASDAIVVVDAHGHITLVNARVEEMFGYQRDELLGQPVEILVPRAAKKIHAQHRKRYMTRPHARPMGAIQNLTGRRKDGTEFPIEISLGSTDSGDGDFVMAFVADATERKRTEKAVQETLEALQKRNRDLDLLNQAGQKLTATLDLDRVVVQLLHAVTETIGAQASSVWLWDQLDAGWLVCQAAFDSGESYPLVNVRLSPGQGIAGWVAQNGESVIVSRASKDDRFSAEVDAQIGFHTTSLLAVPLQVRDEVIGVLEVVNKLDGEFDQDDLALVETLAASAAIALDNARLIEELRQQTEELQARNEELDAFAHTVAHDLKGPTGLIIGFAQTLEENFAEIAPKELRRHLRTITRNGRKMNSIIKELLLWAGVRKAQVEAEPVEMASVVAEVRERLTFLLEEHQVELLLPDEWPTSLGYAPWIEEVWVNYISNAIKYGGQPPRVELGGTPQPDGTVRYWVRDNGPGIAPEAQERLFVPFTQLASVRAQGHGLGLSIVRRIVEKLGGEAGVESKTGEGSIFFFTLPTTG